jgi:hypothetical protein
MRKTIPAGQTETVRVFNTDPFLLSAQPAPGATARVEFSIDAAAIVGTPDEKFWPWTKGDVTQDTLDSFDYSVSFLRLSSTGGPSTFVTREAI